MCAQSIQSQQHDLIRRRRNLFIIACLLIHAIVAGVALAIQLEKQARVVQPQRAAVKPPLAQRRGDAVQGQRVLHHLQGWLESQVHGD